MADPLSISVAIVALIDFTEKIITIANDIKNAIKELQSIVGGLKSLHYLIQRLDERRKGANEKDPWFRGLLELERTSGKLTADWNYEPNPKYKPEGALAQLKMTMAEIHTKLEPHGLKKYKFVKRIRWHWEKDSFTGLLSDIARSRSEISDILDHDHFDLAKHHLEVAGAAKKEGQDTNQQVGELVDYKRRREDRERRDEDDAEKAAIEQWLSPLECLARQKKLFANSFPAGQWLLDSVAFKHWTDGRPWYLRCYGEVGSGKVSCTRSNVFRFPVSDDFPRLYSPQS